VTLFAHYSTDYVGHSGHMWEAVDALQKVDEFLEGVEAAMREDTLVAVVSDHGNIEDITAGHTFNPAIGLFFGPQHERFREARSLADITPIILSVLADTHRDDGGDE
jgi:2,3-bisphosphoglycerate-independent phosphoglycerate mutase